VACAHREPLLPGQLRRPQAKRVVAAADGWADPDPGHHVRVFLSVADPDVGGWRAGSRSRSLRKLRHLEEAAPGAQLIGRGRMPRPSPSLTGDGSWRTP